MSNAPVDNCPGCETTGGRLSCPEHGRQCFYHGEIARATLPNPFSPEARITELERQLAAEKAAHAECSRMLGARINECRELIEKLDSEETRRETAEADLATERERLDWWFSQRNTIPFYEITGALLDHKATPDEWRAAIDAAREKEKV